MFGWFKKKKNEEEVEELLQEGQKEKEMEEESDSDSPVEAGFEDVKGQDLEEEKIKDNQVPQDNKRDVEKADKVDSQDEDWEKMEDWLDILQDKKEGSHKDDSQIQEKNESEKKSEEESQESKAVKQAAEEAAEEDAKDVELEKDELEEIELKEDGKKGAVFEDKEALETEEYESFEEYKDRGEDLDLELKDIEASQEGLNKQVDLLEKSAGTFEKLIDRDEKIDEVEKEEEKNREESKEPEESKEETKTESKDETEESKEKKSGGFRALFSGLNKTRKKIGDQLDNLLNNYSEIDEDLYEEIEDILITADIGMTCTMELIDRLKEELVKRKVKDAGKVKLVLRDVMAEYLKIDGDYEIAKESPTVILVIGVNGAGKTTSIGKISYKLKQEGKKVVLAAADTFRAAAIDQLKVWAERAEVGFVAHTEGSDPSAVIFDGIKSAQAKNADVLICDTAGRLHNKVNLMKELNKMFRIIEREYPEAHKEVLLVLDATTGQNAVNQAKEFLQTAGITGLVLTKLDGTAKGGFVFAIKSELGIPVKLVGVGEKIEDLQTFEPQAYASAILNI